MHAKIHDKRYPDGSIRRVIAACDTALLGKILQEGEIILDLKTYKSFYEGKKVSEAELLEILKGAENLNLVGEEVINAAAKVLPIDAKKARTIGGVPHLQFYKM